jgi:hypothetical protein
MKRVLFDRDDYELLKFLRRLIEQRGQQKSLTRLFDPYLHTHGIKELAASREVRIAYAMIKLLGSLEMGEVEERLSAMRALHAEITSADKSLFRLNTARVLLQIMKEIVRCQDNEEHQLELIHSFRTALAGRPKTIRRELHKYHLLEMSEEWNQVAFDDHVHDANTKGRKTSSHLIMDAWIKGIRSLKIIYYNHIKPDAAYELLEAAKIMGVKARISVEFAVKFEGRYVSMIWAPRGFFSSQDFLNFLQRESVSALMKDGAILSEYQSSYTLAVLENFNRKYLAEINSKFKLEIAPILPAELIQFAGGGQISRVHLAELIHSKIKTATTTEQKVPLSGELYDAYLITKAHPDISYPGNFTGGEELPELLKFTTETLIKRLSEINNSYRLTLNLSHLNIEDVLELLFIAKGRITHLEIFNLKDYAADASNTHQTIEKLRKIINAQNVIRLKHFLLDLLKQINDSDDLDKKVRADKLKSYLDRLSELLAFYQHTQLRTQIGSDSTGRAWHFYGMGIAALDSLPSGVQQKFKAGKPAHRLLLPYSIPIYFRKTYIPRNGHGAWVDRLLHSVRGLPFINNIGYRSESEWVEEDSPTERSQRSQLVALGGAGLLDTGTRDLTAGSLAHTSRYMNTGMRNLTKVLIGFIPAFLTFVLTKNDWWVLQYGGAFIWFGITGVRNIIQSVLGGRGLRRSDLMSWSNFVSWGRVADSLLFTGFSVPLLDYLVKTLLLNRGFGITTTTSPIMLYTIMAIVNGCYISTHNIFRGLPKGAVIGNFFRSIISIPVAILFNGIVGSLLHMAGIQGVDDILQKWAAVISKFASDSVAGFIEGSADRFNNIRVRQEDYKQKTNQIFETFAKIELLFPRQDITQLLATDPSKFLATIAETSCELKEIAVVNALDMLYMWMYQPRARDAFKTSFMAMTKDEQKIILLSNNILTCEKELSTILVQGLLGKKFAKPLAFYLERSKIYLQNMDSLATL